MCRAVVLIILLLCAVRNLPWHLDSLDQAKQAYTSFEIVHGGDPLYQHTPSGKVATKPPLVAWISTALYFLAGSHGWEWAWRLPSIAAILYLLACLWKGGRLLSGNQVGALLTIGAFGLNTFTPRMATVVRTDAVLTALIFALGYQIMIKLHGNRQWSTSDRWITFGIVLAALMTKGPIVYIFLLPGLLAYAWLNRGRVDAPSAWAGWWCWFTPLALFGLWAWAGIATVPDFQKQVVGHEFLGRMTTGEHAVHHNMSPGFYALNLLTKAFPWSLLLGVFMFTVTRHRRSAWRSDPALLWLLCWTFGGLIFMELVPSKRFDRIFPVVPPACLLLAGLARHLPEGQWRGQSVRRLAIFCTVVGITIATGYAGWRIVESFQGDARALVRFGQQVATEVADRHDQLAVVAARDEGLLLYCQQPRFTLRRDALAAWKFGRITWLVISDRELKKIAAELGGFTTLSTVQKLEETDSGYHFLQRLQPGDTPVPSTGKPRKSQEQDSGHSTR